MTTRIELTDRKGNQATLAARRMTSDQMAEEGIVSRAMETATIGIGIEPIEMTLDTFEDGATWLYIGWPEANGHRPDELCVPCSPDALQAFAAGLSRLARQPAHQRR